MAVVTPTDRPKSVRNRCVIELFVALFVLSLCPFDISVRVGAFVIGLSQISSFFSLRIVDIRTEKFTSRPHLYKQPPSRSVKALKRKMERLRSKYVFAPADNAASLSEKDTTLMFEGGLNSYVPAQLTKDKLSLHHIDTLTKINVKIEKCELPTFYWLVKLHKNPFKSRFISNSSHWSTVILLKHITSALTAVRDHVIKYSETAFSNSKRKRKRSDSVLWQKPLNQQKCQKGKVTTQTKSQKSSITQRLRADLKRSVGVTTATQLVWLTWFTGPTFPIPATAV